MIDERNGATVNTFEMMMMMKRVSTIERSAFFFHDSSEVASIFE